MKYKTSHPFFFSKEVKCGKYIYFVAMVFISQMNIYASQFQLGIDLLHGSGLLCLRFCKWLNVDISCNIYINGRITFFLLLYENQSLLPADQGKQYLFKFTCKLHLKLPIVLSFNKVITNSGLSMTSENLTTTDFNQIVCNINSVSFVYCIFVH